MVDKDLLKNYNWFLFEEVHDYAFWMAECPIAALFTDLVHEVGVGLSHGFFIFNKEMMYMYFVKDEYEHAGQFMLKKTLSDKTFLKNILDSIEQLSKKLIMFAGDLHKTDFSQLDKAALWELYDKFHQIHHPLWVMGQAVNFLEMIHSLLSDEFKKQLIQKGIPQDKIEEAVNVLVMPERYSFAQKEEQDLIHLALQDKISDEDITLHWKKYAWNGYNWIGPAWDKSYFEERLKFLKKDPEVKKLLKDEAEYVASVRKKKEQLIKQYNLSEEILEISKLLENIIYLKGLRIDASWQGYWGIEGLLKEVGKRYNLTFRQLQYVMPTEMESLILHNQFDVDKLNARWKHSAFIFNGDKKEEIHGREALEYLEELQKITGMKYEGIQEIKGDCGSPGKAKGVVKLVNRAEDIGKINKGEILVSHATNPRLVPAMKKAAAVIADVGGITCHAAIMSRELRIPCVIGTKIATKVLKDGDEVEVDADKGIVKIIKK
jgi:phosphohistidine swiveling domain-containing protein